MEKEKIGFFGGCFNPPSNIHIELAENLIKNKTVDKVVFVPVNNFYSKKDLIEFKHRYTMLKFAIEGFENLEVDDLENSLNQKMYAIDVFKLIYNKYTDKDIYFIMGTDNFEKIENWKNYEELKQYKYIVLNRQKDIISSTEIRKRIKEGSNIKEILNKKVYNYIKKNNLYTN